MIHKVRYAINYDQIIVAIDRSYEVVDISLLNTQHYKVRIKGKVEQSKERSCALPFTSA